MRIAIEWIIDSNNRTIIKQKTEYVPTMKRDKDEREDCKMNVDYSMKKANQEMSCDEYLK